MVNLNEKILELLKVHSNYNPTLRNNIIEKVDFEDLSIAIADLCQSISIVKQTSKEVFLASRMIIGEENSNHYLNKEDLKDNIELKYTSLEHFLQEKARNKGKKRLVKF